MEEIYINSNKSAAFKNILFKGHKFNKWSHMHAGPSRQKSKKKISMMLMAQYLKFRASLKSQIRDTLWSRKPIAILEVFSRRG